jgi:D-alanine-D-alanine ligase
MTDRATVLVLRGGPDAERAVSLMSGAAVAGALRASERFRVVDEIIDRPTADDLLTIAQRHEVDVVFPVLHGHWGEGGPLQKLLERIGLPYVGAAPRAAAIAMDKHETKLLLARDDVPTPPWRELNAEDDCALEPPLVLKPVDDGSSVDLRICRTPDEVRSARAELHPKRGRLLAERYIKGRELTVGIICGDTLPLIEIVPAGEFYDYGAKYERDDTRYVVNPEVPTSIVNRCRDIALLSFERIGCRDIARVDVIWDGDQPWFLEINTMPGFTSHSLVPMAARATGVEMPSLCASLVDAALGRRTPAASISSSE